LRLGPGDSPFLSGFSPEFEIENGVSSHWTGNDGAIEIPVSVSGHATLTYRLARVLPQTAHVEVLFAGRVVDRFSCRGGSLVDREVDLGSLDGSPVSLAFHVDSHEDRRLGLKLHFVRVDAGAARLRGAAVRLRAPALVLLFAGALLLAGFHDREAALLTAALAVGLSVGLLVDPWPFERALVLLPEVLLVIVLPLLLWGRREVGKGRLKPEDLRLASACGIIAFLLRGLALNAPLFYYPDFTLHARLVEVVRSAGLAFLVHPARYIWAPVSGAEGSGLVRSASGLWMRAVNGAPLGMPYSLAFHVPFALVPLGYDATLTAIRVAGALLAALTIPSALLVARRGGLAPLGVVLLVFVPSYMAKLTVGALPAVFGHCVDMAFLAWLAGRAADLRKPRVLLLGVALVALCDLAYVSAVIHVSVFLAVLALFLSVGERRIALGPLVLAAGGGAIATLLYYRDFLPAVVLLVRGVGRAGSSNYVAEAFLPLLASRTLSFFGWGYPLLALAGLVLAVRRRSWGLLLPWATTYLVLLFLRSLVPLVFRWVHDTLFVTPLLCLAAGLALQELWARKGLPRLLGGALVLALALQGLVLGSLAVGLGAPRIP
jgi:hypothetical protein